MSAVFEQCRQAGDHAWEPPEPDPNMERPQICTVCGTQRFSAKNGNGELVARRYVYVRDLETDEIVRTIETKHAPDSSRYGKFVAGLERATDLDRFYVDEGDES